MKYNLIHNGKVTCFETKKLIWPILDIFLGRRSKTKPYTIPAIFLNVCYRNTLDTLQSLHSADSIALI